MCLDLVAHRSLEDHLLLALQEMWRLVEAHPEEYLAAQAAALAECVNRQGAAPGRAFHEMCVDRAVQRLHQLEESQKVSWQLPVRDLARLVTVTLNGLVNSYLMTGDSASCRRVLVTLASDVARHGCPAPSLQSRN